ncbi:hypothetical protein [Blastochloris tepida]|uniref:Uncharacterized protein n=1 Tax=Blastochloris tepida TaxID=2233851 RepID=A0A348FZ95_9HYPH|nr:hypothetical protein [Blastochloris tepida]BBF92628.1 hypothetical protein BLTE_13130 [Blastochloris tepida]
MAAFTDAYRAEAEGLLASMLITDAARIDRAAKRILKIKPLLLETSAKTGIPWYWIGAILERESACNTKRHVHNGDPLSNRTVNVPAGRLPAPAKPPFKFSDSAFDALCVLKGLHKVGDWTHARMAYEAERYNGFGYRRMGRRSPYLWAGTSHQQIGKYVADGKFDPGVTDRQPGVMPIIARVLELDSGSQLPSPAIPSKADLEVEADHQKERAEAAAGGAVVLSAGGGGAGSAEAIRPAAPSDAVAAVDWTSVALWFGAIGLLCLAVWLLWRVGVLVKAEVTLRRAAAELDAWADKRAALPGPAHGHDWTQTAQ